MVRRRSVGAVAVAAGAVIGRNPCVSDAPARETHGLVVGVNRATAFTAFADDFTSIAGFGRGGGEREQAQSHGGEGEEFLHI